MTVNPRIVALARELRRRFPAVVTDSGIDPHRVRTDFGHTGKGTRAEQARPSTGRLESHGARELEASKGGRA